MPDSPDLGFSKEGAQAIIEQLRGGAKIRLPFDRIRLMMGLLMKASARNGVYESTAIPAPLLIHRARRLEKKGKWFKSINDLGPTPSNKTSAYGRCHYPSRPPVGYWSLYEHTALSEVRAELKEHYVISTFKMPKGSLLIPIGDLDSYRRVGQTRLGHAFKKSSNRYKDILTRRDWAIIAMFDAFLADEFIKPAMTETDYKITSAIADVLLYTDLKNVGRVDGIVYPSVAFREGINFAVRNEVFKSKMVPVIAKTKIVEITDVFGYGIFAWRVLATLKSVNPDGRLGWELSS